VKLEEIGHEIRRSRLARGLTQAQVASRLGIKQARYAFIETHPETVSTKQLLDVFAALGVDILLRLRSDPKAAGSGGDW